MKPRAKPVYIEREQRKALFQMLAEAVRHRASLIPELPETTVVRRARRVIKEHDTLAWTRNRRGRELVERAAKRVRELILFGSDVQAALAAVKRFRAGK